MINSKFALGTVQFGLDYGISNKKGQVSVEEVSEILNFSIKNGIDTLDTAYGYGNSEEVLGNIDTSQKFKIISKLPILSKNEKAETFFFESLKRLKQKSIYAYMFHDFDFF